MQHDDSDVNFDTFVMFLSASRTWTSSVVTRTPSTPAYRCTTLLNSVDLFTIEKKKKRKRKRNIYVTDMLTKHGAQLAADYTLRKLIILNNFKNAQPTQAR